MINFNYSFKNSFFAELWVDKPKWNFGVMLRKRDESAIGIGWCFVRRYYEVYLQLWFVDFAVGFSLNDDSD